MADTKTETRKTAPVRLMPLDAANVLVPHDRPLSDYLTGVAGSEYPRRQGLWAAAADFLYELRWKGLDTSLDVAPSDGIAPAEGVEGKEGTSRQYFRSAISIQPPPPPPPSKKQPERAPVLTPKAKPVPASVVASSGTAIFEVPIIRDPNKPVEESPAASAPEKSASAPVSPASKIASNGEVSPKETSREAEGHSPGKPAPAAAPPKPAPVPAVPAKPALPAKPAVAQTAKPPHITAPPPKTVVPKPAPSVAAKVPAAPAASTTSAVAAVAEKPVVEARTADSKPVELPGPDVPRPASRTVVVPKPTEPGEQAKPSAREVAKPIEQAPEPVRTPETSFKPEPLAVPSFGGAGISSSSSYADTLPEPGGGIPVAVKIGGPLVVLAAIGWFVFAGGSSTETRKPQPASHAESLTVGEQGWVTEWASDAGGSRRGRQLTLYRPSMSLSDYKLKFSGTIEKGALGWVFRAADTKNYYAMKIVVTRPGPNPSLSITRLAVVEGRESSYNEKPLAVTAGANLTFNVVLDVKGPQFTASVQGQPVDVWTDNRLKSGAVGFMNEREERARTTAVQFDYDPNKR